MPGAVDLDDQLPEPPLAASLPRARSSRAHRGAGAGDGEIASVTTTCGVSVSCDDGGTSSSFGDITTCTFQTPAKDCELTVTFQDGTQRTLPVSVYSNGPDCGTAGVYGIALPLECDDGGVGTDAGVLDASDAATDATDDGASDAGVDATAD